jgi:hypothetical protein
MVDADTGNTSARLFGSTLALRSLNFLVVGIVAAWQSELKESPKSADSTHFGSGERKKRNVEIEDEIFDVAVPCADDASSVLVRYGGMGKRVQRLAFSGHECLCSRLDPSQVDC